jgi:hypothetical protein
MFPSSPNLLLNSLYLMKAESVRGRILLPVNDNLTKLAFQAMNRVRTKNAKRIIIRLESINLEKLFHILQDLDMGNGQIAKLQKFLNWTLNYLRLYPGSFKKVLSIIKL